MALRRARRVLLVTCAALAAGATGTALATTVTYSGDDTTVIVTGGDDANHQLQFRLSADLANDEIIDVLPITPKPSNCTYVVSQTWVSCPAHTNVQVDLGAGNDEVRFESGGSDCFNAYTINLGDGANTSVLNSGCPTAPAETATVTSGSGPDTLTGGNQGTTTFSAGGGDDNVSAGSGDDVLHGGEGNDRLFGNAGNDQVLGEGGDDAVNGGAGNDLQDGGVGDDGLGLCSSCALSGNDPGGGSDTYVGGSGTDKLWLDAHVGGMAISIDGAANDGTPGESDNVGSDIESIEGTGGNDVFTGSAGPDAFSGGGGSDEIHGGAGDDDLYGDSGDDKLLGDAGNDKVQGASGADTVDGGAGADKLYGDIAACSVFCTFDSDTLLARDGETDAVDCGGGADTAQVDFADVVAFCTSVDRSPAPGVTPGPGTAPGPTAAPTTAAITTVGTLHITTGLRLVVSCPDKCTFKVVVIVNAATAKRYHLGSRSLTIGTASGALAAAGRRSVKLTLTAKARRRLKRAKRVPATLRLTVRNSAGKVTTKTKRVTLRH